MKIINKHTFAIAACLSATLFSPLSFSAEAQTPNASNELPANHVAVPGQTPSLALKDLIKQRKLDKIEADLRTLVENNPDSVQAKSRLGGFLLSQNKTGEAIPFYQEAITLNPAEPKLFAALSVAYLHQSHYSMAKAMADEALRLAPDMAQAKKLNEYIDAKKQVLEMAEKAAAADSLTPVDDIHKKTSKE